MTERPSAPAPRRPGRANFAVWLVYLALAPSHWYPVPFAPFAPGSAGLTDAVLR